MEGLVADVASQGDPARGEALFRRADLQCLNCHAVAGAGGLVGPGLESIGASAQVDYLIDSILQPNKAVKEGYHSIVVATDDGRVLTGIVQLRTDEELVLRDADGREVRLATASVEAEKPGESLMPAGLTDAITRSELVDLVKFLSSLGRPGPYAVGPRRLVRRWEVLPATPEASRAVHRLGLDAAVAANDPALAWAPAYSAVSGALPLSDVPAVTGLPGTGSPTKKWARFALDVSTGGPVRLKLDPAEGITAWVDGRRAEAAGTMDLDLKPGRHVVTLAIDPSARSADSLAVELVDVPGSPAKVQAVLGK
jgi:putative heme-binding domain-containing protein